MPGAGTDTYADLKNGKWKRGAELQKLVSLVVVARPGVTYSCTDEEASDPRYDDHIATSTEELWRVWLRVCGSVCGCGVCGAGCRSTTCPT